MLGARAAAEGARVQRLSELAAGALTRGVGKSRRIRVFLPRMLVLLSRFSFLHVFGPLLRRLLGGAELRRELGATQRHFAAWFTPNAVARQWARTLEALSAHKV